MKPGVILERESSTEGTASSKPQDGSGLAEILEDHEGKVQEAKRRVEGKKRVRKIAEPPGGLVDHDKGFEHWEAIERF